MSVLASNLILIALFGFVGEETDQIRVTYECDVEYRAGIDTNHLEGSKPIAVTGEDKEEFFAIEMVYSPNSDECAENCYKNLKVREVASKRGRAKVPEWCGIPDTQVLTQSYSIYRSDGSWTDLHVDKDLGFLRLVGRLGSEEISFWQSAFQYADCEDIKLNSRLGACKRRD